jgi:hypothetical protein
LLQPLATIAYYLIAVGIVSGLIAAVFGLIDWLAIPAGARAKRIGLLEGQRCDAFFATTDYRSLCSASS